MSTSGTTGKSASGRRQLFEQALRKKGIAVPSATTITRRPASAASQCQLSFAQQRLWLLDQLTPGDATYNMPSALRLVGTLDLPALRRTLRHLTNRHESLRTTFASRDGSPFQVIHQSMGYALPLVDLSPLDERVRDRAAHALAAEEARRPFDLTRGPLLRVTLLRMAAREHVALFTMHHIVSDGWSMSVLVKEVAALYEAFVRGHDSPLTELPVQYADYAVWQRGYLRGEVLERQLGYWRERLSGADEVLELPTDRPRPNVRGHGGARETARVSREVAERLRALSHGEGATLFMTLLAGWQTLLQRYSGERRISVGTPVAGRTLPESEGLIGLFLNTLVLRTDLSGDPSFRELLRRVKEVCLGAYAHQDVPFERIIEELQPERSLSHTPLFQVMFNLLNQGDDRIELTGLSIEGWSPEQYDSKFDLTLYAAERDEEIHLTLNYSLDLFERATARAMLGHLVTLLEGVAADPERRISKLPLLSPAERGRLMSRSNRVGQDGPFAEFEKQEVEQSIASCFARRTRDHLDEAAVVSKTCRWTYRELDELTDRVARAVLAASREADEHVALLFEHDAPLAAGVLGALKAGRTYVPLDPLYPSERINYILADSRATTILTNEKNLALAEKLAGGTRRVLNIDAPDEGALADAAPLPETTPDAPAYILYTSGSTGRPKGTLQTHRGVLHHIRNYTNNLRISSRDRLTLLSSYSFDAAVMDIFGALLNGAALCPFDVREDGFDDLPRRLVEQRVTIYHSTPTVYRYFTGGLTGAERFPDVRLVVLGGEEVFRSDVESCRKHFEPGCVFVNGLGPTESTVTLQYFVGRETEIVGSGVPVGYPVEDTEVLLLDEAGEEVEGFGVGEIVIKSAHLARGYWRQPELTRAVFLPDPEGGDKRIYRTGDFGRRLADGSLMFVGRRDRQVKVRGHRVELSEIEAALGSHPHLDEAAVVAREDEGGALRLEAFYVAKQGTTLTAPSLREYLKERLPEYMLPTAWAALEEMPLTPSGKVDRQRLPAVPRAERATAAGVFVAPRTVVEEIVAGVWQELLRVGEVGAEDNFFDLGGHSLLGTQAISRIRETLGVEVPLRALFEHPTVAALAACIDERLGVGVDPDTLRIERAPRGDGLEPSFAQQRLWLLDQLTPGDTAYNMPSALRLVGTLDLPALRRTLLRLADRHEVLRTTFADRDGSPFQVISPSPSLTLPVVDLSTLDEGRRDRAAQVLAAEEARRPFDLGRGPLLRVTLLRLSGEEHVALFTMHHIASDGWSMGVLVREVAALYEAFVQGHDSPLTELPIQYADYAVWQREWLQGEVLERQLDYWRGQLAGAPPVLELPTDRPRPNVQRRGGGREVARVSRKVAEALKALSRREGATLFMSLLAGFQTLLARYTGQEDISVGSPVAGRNLTETEGLIGFFVNTLVLRAGLGGDPTFGELLRRVREVCLGAYAHQDVPFEMLVQELQPERSLSHTPLFQVTLTLQNAPEETLELPGLKVYPFKAETESAKFDLSLLVSEDEQGLALALVYNSELFEAATIRRMLGHFEQLLAGAAANPARRVSELPLLTEEERHRLLVEWNETREEYPRELCLHELFEEQVGRAGEAVALVFGEERLTYEELNRRANQLAHHLRTLGVGPETSVGLCLERSVEMVVALLGIVKAGGAYVPLDPEYPMERLSLMLDDAGVSVLLTREELLDVLPTHWAHVVCVDTERELIDEREEGNPNVRALPDNLAYVSYTSGSTGRPKGVGVTHRNIARLVKQDAYADFDADKVFLQLAPLPFDASTFEIWGSLLNGARLVVMSPAAPSLEELGQALRRHGVTTLWLTAGLFHLMVDARLEDLCGLEQLLAGGDVLSPRHVARVLKELPGVEVINGYGPTETTTFACCQRLGRPEEVGASVAIGRPIANTRVYVLDGAMRPVPIGVAGELYIGGDGLARGYLNRAALTAERFVPDPYSKEGGRRLYRTGDLVRYLEDGRLEFMGRADHQVKVRGFRVEPGEVEAALGRHAAVRECVVVAREDVPGDKRLVAYVVADEGSRPLAVELREHLRNSLPEHLVPSAVVLLDELPLTPNGKVDRRRLPAPHEAREREEDAYAAPLTPVEEIVAGVFAEVLKVERVGRDDDFFELGGHSLLATQLISRVREAFGVEVPLRHLFDAPVLANFAAAVEEASRADGCDVPAPPILPVARDRALPLSFAQQRLWFLDQLEPGSAFYNVPFALRLTGRLDARALGRALNEIVRRHEVLRTTFAFEDGEPLQVVRPAESLPLHVVDLTGAASGEREALAEQVIAAEARRPFDLSRGPLLRAVVIRLAEEEHAGLFTLHHIVSDGWSIGVMVRELTALYEAYTRGADSPLEELGVQYADYAVWQRRWLQGEVLERQLAYWRRQLGDAPALLELPTVGPRPPFQTRHGARLSFVVPDELAEALQALSRREGVTLFMTLLAAWQTLLSRYTGQKSVSVGTPIANRTRAETEGLIGFFVNTLVLRTDLTDEPSFRELLRRVRETCLGAYAHQDVPFERVVEELQPERSLSYSPLFQVMFILQNAPSETLELPGLQLRPFGTKTRTAKFDLTLSLNEAADGLLGSLEYNTDLFDEESVARMINHFQVLLAGAVADPERKVGELPLLTGEDRRRLFFDFNDTRAPYPADLRLQNFFERQAALTAEAVAVSAGDARLTYHELNRRADVLARRLRGLGVGPEVRVGVMLERSAGMVVGVLGVLKAGGAYVPLDPAYPKERLAFMLEDSGAALLLTQGSLQHLAPEGAPPRLLIDVEADSDDAPTEVAASDSVHPENLAYVIYTSGSTGRPKGVAITHRSASAFLAWAYRAFPLDSLRAVLASTSLCFDLSVFELFAPLGCGGACVVVPDALHAGEATEPITLVNTVPSAMAELVRLRVLPSSVEVVNLAGEPLPGRLARAVYAAHPSVREVRNLYGPSEDTTYSTWAVAPREEGVEPRIGRPVENTRAYVLDERMEPVAEGVLGELYLGGAGLARCYLNRPGLTAERFVPDPHSGAAGARLYRTGDMVRWRGGELDYLGRSDGQVKVRGFRIELGEIEAALRGVAGVRECAVVVREQSGGGRQLVGYLVKEAGAEIGTEDVRRSLRERLPEYMIPGAWVWLDELPRTPNGKLDRRALPDPETARPELASAYVAARTAAERVVASIFTEVLGVERVGVTDDFFALGGHSLLATRVVARVGKVFQTGLELRRLFERPTVEGVVEALAERWGDRQLVEVIAETFIEVGEMSECDAGALLAQLKEGE